MSVHTLLFTHRGNLHLAIVGPQGIVSVTSADDADAISYALGTPLYVKVAASDSTSSALGAAMSAWDELEAQYAKGKIQIDPEVFSLVADNRPNRSDDLPGAQKKITAHPQR